MTRNLFSLSQNPLCPCFLLFGQKKFLSAVLSPLPSHFMAHSTATWPNQSFGFDGSVPATLLGDTIQTTNGMDVCGKFQFFGAWKNEKWSWPEGRNFGNFGSEKWAGKVKEKFNFGIGNKQKIYGLETLKKNLKILQKFLIKI